MARGPQGFVERTEAGADVRAQVGTHSTRLVTQGPVYFPTQLYFPFFVVVCILDVYNRILRFTNYMVALVNKDVLPIKFELPYFGEVYANPCTTPFHATFLTHERTMIMPSRHWN